MIQNDIAMSRVEIDQARLMTLQAARCIDRMGTKRARKQVKYLQNNGRKRSGRTNFIIVDHSRARNKGGSTDIVWSELAIDRTKSLITGPDILSGQITTRAL